MAQDAVLMPNYSIQGFANCFVLYTLALKAVPCSLFKIVCSNACFFKLFSTTIV